MIDLTTIQLSRYGMSGKPVGIAFDPVQSLLAISTDRGEIHVYGQQQVEVVFILNSDIPITNLRFVKGIYLVAVDARSTIMVFSIYSKKMLSTFSPPGKVTAIETDPSLDWLLLGLQNGSVYAYDIDRGNITPFKIDNLQKQVLPKEKLSPVVSIQWNPRDIGTVLIAYSNCAIVYSLATNEIRLSFRYEVPKGAPGGNNLINSTIRYPRVLQALYHPNSLGVLTTHEDGSLVFWDSLTGEQLHARSLFDIDVNVPQGFAPTVEGAVNTEFLKVAWLCEDNPDITSLVIAGGDGPSHEGIHNLSVINFGVAPKYSITSYEKMGRHYAEPKQQRFLPIQNQASVIDFLALSRSSPYFGGNHNPSFIVVLLESGEIETLAYPKGILNYKSALFPQSIAWVHPHTTYTVAAPVPRKQWLGMIGKSSKRENILKGGYPVKKPLRANEVRAALATGHSNGSVRIWDASHAELDESSVMEVNVSAALNTITNVAVDNVSFAGETAELAVATVGGDVALFKFDINRKYNPNIGDIEQDMSRLSLQEETSLMVNLSKRTPNIKEGFLPIVAIHAKRGRVTSLKNSNIGFVAIAYESGDLIIVDRRGPAIIFEQDITHYSQAGSTRITALEFSIMVFGDDGYSSILLFAGTDKGELLTFKLLPESSGRFSAKVSDLIQSNDYPITCISPFKSDSGIPAFATFDQFHQLSNGLVVQGSIVVASTSDIRIVTPAKAKLTHKLFNIPISAAGISVISVKQPNVSKPYGAVFQVLLQTGTIKVLSLPELREISSLQLPYSVDPHFVKYSSVLPSGDAVIRIGRSEAGLVNIAGEGITAAQLPSDKLYNEKLRIPYRPQVGALQWAKGTTLVSYEDLDRLIGGERRQKSKNPESDIANGNMTYDIKDSKNNSNEQLAGEDFSYAKPVRKRTQGGYDPTRSIVRAFQNGVETAEESFNDYANNASQNMNETIGEAKNDLVKSILKSKFGF